MDRKSFFHNRDYTLTRYKFYPPKYVIDMKYLRVFILDLFNANGEVKYVRSVRIKRQKNSNLL